MGSRGPVADPNSARTETKQKRLERQASKPEIVTSYTQYSFVQPFTPPLLDPHNQLNLHPAAVEFWDALTESPESKTYSPAVWQRAKLMAYQVSELYFSSKLSAQALLALQGDMKALLIDPGERIRLGIDLMEAEQRMLKTADDFRNDPDFDDAVDSAR